MRIERQRFERNREFGDPAVLEPPGLTLEDRVPSGVEIRDVQIQAVVANAVRVQAEKVAAPPVVERVEGHIEAIVLADRVVLPQVLRSDARRIGVVEPRADVQRVVVVEEQYFRALLGLRIFDRRGLMQIVDECSRRPDRVVEPAVDHGRSRGANHPHGLVSRIARRLGLLRPCRSTAAKHQRPSPPPEIEHDFPSTSPREGRTIPERRG